MTRELNRSYGYQESHVTLSPSVGSVGPYPRLFGFGHSNHTVYPVPLDPSNLPTLDLRVVKWQVMTPSHVRPSRVPGKVDIPKPHCLGTRTCAPTRRNLGAHT
ncbi:hypothetical protein CRG98_018793 [Punica granatum]|uniref:Uncharacterized protein n=1 Tax=Punica granatum TaxID=22663 RepID=A0A2I0JWW7_PUNGR|nr:hypothetical protein CRG98_018793 [Punica granatum]